MHTCMYALTLTHAHNKGASRDVTMGLPMCDLILHDLCFQVLIDGTDSPPYAKINVGEGLINPAVARDMTFDLAQKHVYVLTGDRVSTRYTHFSIVSNMQMGPDHCLILGGNHI